MSNNISIGINVDRTQLQQAIRDIQQYRQEHSSIFGRVNISQNQQVSSAWQQAQSQQAVGGTRATEMLKQFGGIDKGADRIYKTMTQWQGAAARKIGGILWITRK